VGPEAPGTVPAGGGRPVPAEPFVSPAPAPAVAPAVIPLPASTNPINCSSHPSVTTTSLLSSTKYSPPAASTPWLIAAVSPRALAFAITLTGIGASARTLARYAAVSSAEALSTTINSHGARVYRRSAAMHWRVDSSGRQQGRIIDASPRGLLVPMV
jgi:hypothetical protein